MRIAVFRLVTTVVPDDASIFTSHREDVDQAAATPTAGRRKANRRESKRENENKGMVE